MGGGGGRGPARTRVGGCRQERAPLRHRGVQRRAGIQRRDPRREITSRRSGGGTSPPPAAQPVLGSSPPGLLSSGGGGVPRRWSRFIAKANPLMPRSLDWGRRARPPALGLLGREEVVGENRARKGKNPFNEQGRRQQRFYSPEKCLLLEMIFTLFLKSMPSLLVFAGDATNRSKTGRKEHELSSGTCDSRDLLQELQLGHL
ncbi:uncharacterized protein LOC110469320 [Lonchura striata]